MATRAAADLRHPPHFFPAFLFAVSKRGAGGGRSVMTITTIVALVAHGLSGLGFLAFAAAFGLKREWEPWHGEAVGTPWSELPEALRTVIVAIMWAVASGGLALAVAVGVLLPRLAVGDPFARWALPAISLAFALPGATVALGFRRRTGARPPLAPAAIGVALPIVGLVASLL